MKNIVDLINENKINFQNLPLFHFMQDKNISPAQRLDLTPCMAYFVMSFSDLNKYVFRENNAYTDIQHIINEHSNEDEEHWLWYTTDIDKLGLNPTNNFTQALRFIWSEESKITRQISYRIASYSLNASPILKLIIIETLEAVGQIFFTISTEITSELEEMTDIKYMYFGEPHLSVEKGHSMYSSDIKKYLNQIVLSQEENKQAIYIVEKIFEIFSEWTDELLNYAQKQQTKPANDNKVNVALTI